jgi:hypothetical protein
MPLLQKKIVLKDFENHKLKYTMKYGFFSKVLCSFELIIELFIFLNIIFLIQLSTIDKI